ncbi:hypothetical protein TNCV_2361241 [Trichonephila clavipes]|nr:hypothetical protein TNCV_2361241 [Trichonephila clavipes]
MKSRFEYRVSYVCDEVEQMRIKYFKDQFLLDIGVIRMLAKICQLMCQRRHLAVFLELRGMFKCSRVISHESSSTAYEEGAECQELVWNRNRLGSFTCGQLALPAA